MPISLLKKYNPLFHAAISKKSWDEATYFGNRRKVHYKNQQSGGDQAEFEHCKVQTLSTTPYNKDGPIF
jgi:hypothetical protein